MKRSQKKLQFVLSKYSKTKIGEILAYEGPRAIHAQVYRVTGTSILPVGYEGDYLILSGEPLDQLISLLREVSPNWNPQLRYAEVSQDGVIFKDHFLQDEQ